MTSRDFLVLGLITIALVVVLGVVNSHYVRPALTPVLTKPVPLPPVETTMPPVNQDIVATTLEKIKTMFAEREADKGFEPRRVPRNPFLWPDEKPGEQAAQAASPEEGEGHTLPRVTMILIGEHRKIACINEQLVFEGSLFNGDRVDSIKEKEVILTGASGETRLSLAEYTIEPPEQEPVAAPEPPARSQSQEEAIQNLYEKLKPLLEQKPGA
jgi:hypothetical protein